MQREIKFFMTVKRQFSAFNQEIDAIDGHLTVVAQQQSERGEFPRNQDSLWLEQIHSDVNRRDDFPGLMRVFASSLTRVTQVEVAATCAVVADPLQRQLSAAVTPYVLMHAFEGHFDPRAVLVTN